MNRCVAYIRDRSLSRVALYVSRVGSVCDVKLQALSYSHNFFHCPAQPSAHTSSLLERTRNSDRCLPQMLSTSFSSSAPSSRVRVIKSDSEFSTTLQSALGRTIAPVFENLSSKLPDVSFLKVDIDEEALQQTVAAAGIRAVPTFHFYKGGVKVAEVKGADSAKLTETIDQHRTST